MSKKILLALCAALACGMLFGCSSAGGSVASQANAVETTDAASSADTSAVDPNSESAHAASLGITEVDMDYVKAGNAAAVIDIRDFADFAGDLTNDEDRGGHVPGAVNVPYANMVDKNGEPIEQVRLDRIFSHAKLDPEGETVVYGYGSEDAFSVAKLLSVSGYNNVSVWTDGYDAWAADTSNEVEKSSLSCCCVE